MNETEVEAQRIIEKKRETKRSDAEVLERKIQRDEVGNLICLPGGIYEWFPRYVGETEEEHVERCQPTGPPPVDSQKEIHQKEKAIRTFDTGATRDADDGKLDFEGFLSPLTLVRFAEYMHMHRKQSNGEMRSSDNWQKGIPPDAYMKSLWRHLIEVWVSHRNDRDSYDICCDKEEALCAIIFNASGYLHELLKDDKS